MTARRVGSLVVDVLLLALIAAAVVVALQLWHHAQANHQVCTATASTTTVTTGRQNFCNEAAPWAQP